MSVVFISNSDITVNHNGVRYCYRIDKPWQAEEILKKMVPSQAFAWLNKHGTLVATY